MPLDEPAGEDERETLAERLRAEEAPTPFDLVAARQEAARLEQALAALPPREARDAYYLRVEVPGVGKDDVQIELTDGTPVIRGERKLGDGLEPEQWARQEGTCGPFYRLVALPGSADPDRIQARVQDGVLEVIVPKAGEARTKPIPIAA